MGLTKQRTPTRVIRYGGKAAITVRGLLSPAASSPHGELLQHVFAQPRSPPPWQPELRRYKAELARAMGWVPETADDTRALQAFKGRGRRTDLVRVVVYARWDGKAFLNNLVDGPFGCCAWVDYIRARAIRTAAALQADFEKYGIVEVQPSLTTALDAITDLVDVPQATYLRRRRRLGRAVLAKLWSRRRCPDPKDYFRKLMQRARSRWPALRVKLSPAAADALARYWRTRDPLPGAFRLVPSAWAQREADRGFRREAP